MSTCRFCQQWNPPKAQRCAFCQNLLTDTEDRTRTGRTTMSVQQVAAIPRAQKSMFSSRTSSSIPQLSKTQWKIVIYTVLFLGGTIFNALFGSCHCAF